MKNKLELILLMLCLCNLHGISQGENNIWIVGNSAGIDFNVSPPGIYYDGVISLGGQKVTVSDAEGKLLFYSDGQIIRDRNHEIMPNGRGLKGFTATSRQGLLITPSIINQEQYYVFTIDFFFRDLHYSIVDMSLNDGYGDIINKNILLEEEMGPGIIAVQGQCNDIWIITHKYANNQFLMYRVTSKGLDTIPIISTHDSSNEIFGKIMSSPNGKKLAIMVDIEFLNIFDFDAISGNVSNKVEIKYNEITNGLEPVFAFSPNNRFLYVFSRKQTSTENHILYQIDLNNGDSKEEIGQFYKIDEMQIGPDSLIYLTTWQIGRINKPNEFGEDCDIVDSVLNIRSYFLQNLVVMPAPKPPPPSDFLPSDTTVCSGIPISLSVTNPAYDLFWSDSSTTSEITINGPGTYWVDVTIDNCTWRDSIEVVNTDLNPPELGSDTTLCKGDTLDLSIGARAWWQDTILSEKYTVYQPGTYTVRTTAMDCPRHDTIEVGFVELDYSKSDDLFLCAEESGMIQVIPSGDGQLEWIDGEMGETREIDAFGAYSFTISEGQCTIIDSIVVSRRVDCPSSDCSIYIPNVFSPNGDGVNDEFGIQRTCGFSEYELIMYNRWGNQVFSSKDPTEVWTSKGPDIDPGVYVYTLKYRLEGREKIQYLQGDVTVVR